MAKYRHRCCPTIRHQELEKVVLARAVQLDAPTPLYTLPCVCSNILQMPRRVHINLRLRARTIVFWRPTPEQLVRVQAVTEN